MPAKFAYLFLLCHILFVLSFFLKTSSRFDNLCSLLCCSEARQCEHKRTLQSLHWNSQDFFWMCFAFWINQSRSPLVKGNYFVFVIFIWDMVTYTGLAEVDMTKVAVALYYSGLTMVTTGHVLRNVIGIQHPFIEGRGWKLVLEPPADSTHLTYTH